MTVCPITLLIPVVLSQTVPNKSLLVCVKIEKDTFLVTLRPLPGVHEVKRSELRTLRYWARRSQAHFSVSSPPQYSSQANIYFSQKPFSKR